MDVCCARATSAGDPKERQAANPITAHRKRLLIVARSLARCRETPDGQAYRKDATRTQHLLQSQRQRLATRPKKRRPWPSSELPA